VTVSDNLIIIDSDPGADDALAILMALSRQARHLANVLAITTVRYYDLNWVQVWTQ